MKVRDSGMPFDLERTLRTFDLDVGVEALVDFGCGYHTFAIRRFFPFAAGSRRFCFCRRAARRSGPAVHADRPG